MKFFRFLSLQTCTQWHQWQSKSKCLDTSKGHFRTLSLCMSDRCSHLLDFQWHQYVSWRSFAFSNVTMSHSMRSKPYWTSMLHFVVLTQKVFDKDILEHDELRFSQIEHCFQQLRNLPRTGARHGFPWFSMVFRMMALQFLLVQLWFLPSWRRSW